MKAWVRAAGKLARYEHIGWKAVAPQALLGLPLGRDGDGRQLERQLQGELARGGRGGRVACRSGRHGRSEILPGPSPIPVGAAGRGA